MTDLVRATKKATLVGIAIFAIVLMVHMTSHLNDNAFFVLPLGMTQSKEKTLAPPIAYNYSKLVLKKITEQSFQQKAVIILAYMHTGSTFMGDVLMNRPGTFYEYEQLRSLTFATAHGEKIQFMNGTSITFTRVMPDNVTPESINHSDLAAQSVNRNIRCQHEDHDIGTLVTNYHGVNTTFYRDRGLFLTCEGQTQLKTPRIPPKSTIIHCLPILTEKCKTSNLIINKYIRMRMQSAERVLRENDHVKLIHLLRDPRAMMDSQVRKGDRRSQNTQQFRVNTRWICEHMLEDIEVADRLKEVFPGRILTIRYEDLTENPLKVFQSIFDFLQLPMLENDIKHANLTFSRPSWRSHISEKKLGVIDSTCQKVYDKLGYIQYGSLADIRNYKNPTYK